MLPTFKEVVEELFTRGLVKVVFATETLALGINMPARSVVIEKLVKWNGETHADVTPGEYTQLTGRAGRRGIDVEGHGVVLWQPGLNPRELAGLASTRTYPLRSSFRPSYNMAVNLVRQVGRERARELLEPSFAQFQADRGVVGLARQLRKAEEALDGYAEAATCDRGDFVEYARLRRQITEPRERAAARRRDVGPPRARWSTSLEQLRPGDVIEVPARRSPGTPVVVDPGSVRPRRAAAAGAHRRAAGPAAVARRLPDARCVALTRMQVPRNVQRPQPAERRDLASALRTRTHDLRAAPPTVAAAQPRRRAASRTTTEIAGCADAARAPLPRLPRPRGPRPLGRALVQARPGRRHAAAPGRGAHQHRGPAVRPGLRGARRAGLPRRGDEVGHRRGPAADADLRRARPGRRRVPAHRRAARTCRPAELAGRPVRCWSSRRGGPTTTRPRACRAAPAREVIVDAVAAGRALETWRSEHRLDFTARARPRLRLGDVPVGGGRRPRRRARRAPTWPPATSCAG